MFVFQQLYIYVLLVGQVKRDNEGSETFKLEPGQGSALPAIKMDEDDEDDDDDDDDDDMVEVS